MNRRNLLLAAATVGAGLPALAQEKATAIVVPYAPGGSLDTAARLLAEQLRKGVGRNFIVDNKPGANGLIGTKAVQAAAPDGSMLLFNGPNIVTLPINQKAANYDAFKDFTPIACFGKVEYFLVVHESVPGHSVADVIKFARSRPEGIFAGNAGSGSIGHMLAAAFAKHAGINVTHVPYKGASDVMRALAGGEVQMQLTTTTAALEKLAKSGRLRYVAVASEKRSIFAPEVPALRETLPGMLALDSWGALFGPAGMAEDVVRPLSDAARNAMASPDVVARLASQFISPLYLDGHELKIAMANAVTAQQRLKQESGVSG